MTHARTRTHLEQEEGLPVPHALTSTRTRPGHVTRLPAHRAAGRPTFPEKWPDPARHGGARSFLLAFLPCFPVGEHHFNERTQVGDLLLWA